MNYILILAAICTDPCNNGGTCIDPDVCLCPEAFEGDTCENGMFIKSLSFCIFIYYFIDGKATGVVVSGQATGDDDDTSQTGIPLCSQSSKQL